MRTAPPDPTLSSASPRRFGGLGPALGLLGLLGLIAPAGGCSGCVEHPTGDAGDGGLDAGPEDAARPDARPGDGGPEAGTPDAMVRPDARRFEFCDEPVIKMPFDGSNGSLIEQEIEGNHVFYSFWDWAELSQVYRFDLDRCEEQQLTLLGTAGRFGVKQDVLVYDRQGDIDERCRDLNAVSLTNLAISPLLHTAGCESRPRTNGRHVSYLYQPDRQSAGEFRLLDMQTGLQMPLMAPSSGLKSPNLSDRYVVWTGVWPTPQSEGSDVFVHDLATGDTTQLAASYPKWQDWVNVWEDYVTWSGAEGDLVPPYHLVLYDLRTDRMEMLLTDDYAVGVAHIREGLVVYNTSRYSGIHGTRPSDIEIYDVETGIRRRVTTETCYLRASRIDPPYLLFVLSLGGALKYDLYVANLETMGVLDSSGRVIPGDGVLALP